VLQCMNTSMDDVPCRNVARQKFSKVSSLLNLKHTITFELTFEENLSCQNVTWQKFSNISSRLSMLCIMSIDLTFEKSYQRSIVASSVSLGGSSIDDDMFQAAALRPVPYILYICIFYGIYYLIL
jgi:hypothetical protein